MSRLCLSSFNNMVWKNLLNCNKIKFLRNDKHATLPTVSHRCAHLANKSIKKNQASKILSLRNYGSLSTRNWGPYENQNILISDDIDKELHNILKRFPKSIEFAFGYGSGVFKQTKSLDINEDKPQIDLILVVNDTLKFHEENLKLNPNDYSLLRYFGVNIINKFQNWGAGVYFNPYIEINKRQIKYGIISKKLLIKDLKEWNTFYLAGRLQKPVKILMFTNEILHWNQINLLNVATVAEKMIAKDKNFKSISSNKEERELNFYKKITALSYLGDIRYTLGVENPNKVNNIVMNNIINFQKYYKPILTRRLSSTELDNENQNQEQKNTNDEFKISESEFTINNTVKVPPDYNIEINKCIKKLERLIRLISVKQTLKGLFTAGIVKAIRYAWSKKMKSLKAK